MNKWTIAGIGIAIVLLAALYVFFPNGPKFSRFHPERAKLTGPDENALWELEHDFEFHDAAGKKWTARKGTLTDGASIPQAYLSATGSNFDPTFLHAAVVHDAYCGRGNEQGPSYHKEKWQDVHQMFYEACLASGCGEIKAKLMFMAVYFGGPRWELSSGLSPATLPGEPTAETAPVIVSEPVPDPPATQPTTSPSAKPPVKNLNLRNAQLKLKPIPQRPNPVAIQVQPRPQAQRKINDYEAWIRSDNPSLKTIKETLEKERLR